MNDFTLEVFLLVFKHTLVELFLFLTDYNGFFGGGDSFDAAAVDMGGGVEKRGE